MAYGIHRDEKSGKVWAQPYEMFSALVSQKWLPEPPEKEDKLTSDVAQVRHGRWVEPQRLYYGAKQYECSLCYSDTFWKKHSITEKYPCCPNCGAIMDGKQ